MDSEGETVVVSAAYVATGCAFLKMERKRIYQNETVDAVLE
jgi:hypothetical protein